MRQRPTLKKTFQDLPFITLHSGGLHSFRLHRKLRQGRAQQTLFHMSVALLCSEVTLLTGLKATSHYGVCLAVAALLHYFILASFLWMLVEAVLQYLTFVKVLGTYVSKYTLKTVLPAWSKTLLTLFIFDSNPPFFVSFLPFTSRPLEIESARAFYNHIVSFW